MKKRVLINISNLRKGGALQVANSFVQEASQSKDFEFYVILGKASSEVILPEKYEEAANMHFLNVEVHPSDSMMNFFRFRRRLSELENSIMPDAVITVFGPCYWKPQAPHIMGFANGYLLYEDTYFFKVWNGWKTLRYQIKKKFHQYLLKTEASKYWTETDDSRKRLGRFLKKPEERIIVASNNCSHYFRETFFEELPGLPQKKYNRLLYISSYYPHKGFELIPPVLRLLKKKGIPVELVVTLRQEDFLRVFADIDNVVNLGSVAPKYCPYIYRESDIVFVPTLLETFTAIYPEAMYSERPVVTSDLPFARSICGDAALYFDPSSAEDAAEKISALILDPSLQRGLVDKGLQRINAFDLPGERFRKVLQGILDNK